MKKILEALTRNEPVPRMKTPEKITLHDVLMAKNAVSHYRKSEVLPNEVVMWGNSKKESELTFFLWQAWQD